MFVSKILISDAFEELKNELIAQFTINALRFIPKTPADEFLIEDARAVERESYIAEKDEKIIVIMANSFRIEAQNSLLKLLEEPPRNIKFLIVAPSKNLLLPTIRSRLICQKHKKIKEKKFLNLDIKKLDLKMMFEFLKEHENLSKNELLEIISQLSQESLKCKTFNAYELDFFYKSYELAQLNSKAGILLSTLLLNIYTKNEK